MSRSRTPSPRTALILGITGQDGSYLAELLLAKGYEVHGVVRRSSLFNRSRIEHLRAVGGQRAENGGRATERKPETGNLKPER